MKFSSIASMLVTASALTPFSSALVESRDITHSLRGALGGASTATAVDAVTRQADEGEIVDIVDPEGADICDIVVTTECILDGVRCEAIPANRNECTAPPTSMTFRYFYTPCSSSATVQSSDTFSCEDHGPTVSDGSQSYAVIRDAESNSVIFSGIITYEADLTLVADEGETLPASMSIDLYASASLQPNFHVQTVEFDTSCAENTLFLHDSFGSFDVVQFENAEQYETTVVAAENVITITNLLDDSAVTILDVISLTEVGRVESDVDRNGPIIGGASMTVAGEPILIDLNLLRQYTTATSVLGTSASGYVCRATATNEFIAGPF